MSAKARTIPPHVAVDNGFCIVCHHFGKDCTGKLQGNYDRDPNVRIIRAAKAQTAYWHALRDLETATELNLDHVGDLEGLTAQDLIDSFGPDGFGGTDEAEPVDCATLQRHFDD